MGRARVAARGRRVAAPGLASRAGLAGDGPAAGALTRVELWNRRAPGGPRFARVCPAWAWLNRWRRGFRGRYSTRAVRCGPASTVRQPSAPGRIFLLDLAAAIGLRDRRKAGRKTRCFHWG